MKIYTRTGDTGQTGLFGGQRVSKADLRIEACGDVDELNSVLGVTLSLVDDLDLRDVIAKLQNLLFAVGADIATPGTGDITHGQTTVHRIGAEAAADLEPHIDRLEGEIPPLAQFILPGGSRPAALLHFARAVCRRAERRVVELNSHEPLNPHVIAFLNRMSDLLFTMARVANMRNHVLDTFWEHR